MKNPTVIIVLGLPASGKSTLAKRLSAAFNLPLISKDEIKVMLFDAYGWQDREGSMKAGKVSYEIIDYLAEGQLRAGNSLIIESTFNAKFAGPKFRKWQELYGAQYAQICCYADPEVIRARFRHRIETDDRHVSRVEGEAGYKNLETLLGQRVNPLDIAGDVIEVDSTDFSQVDETAIIERLRKTLDKAYVLPFHM